MYLFTVLAFVLLFWQAESPGRWRIVTDSDVRWTLLIVAAQPLLLWCAGRWVTRRTQRRLDSSEYSTTAAQRFYHRATFHLRLVMILGFAVSVLLTRWPNWFAWGRVAPALQIVGDVIVLSPYFLGAVLLWIAAYPLEHGANDTAGRRSTSLHETKRPVRLMSYLDFQIRHHLLVVAVPMTLILFAADLVRGYERAIRRVLPWWWSPDALLGLAAAIVFVTAPWMLCRIWRTQTLDAGPLRTRLDELCARIGLRCRAVLIWRSGGLMVNAAVMGILAPVRYVLLSDALIDAMTPQQVEAVFGHEAGHVRHRHIPHFLAFALVGWLVVVAIMELLARWTSDAGGANGWSPTAIESAGVLAAVGFWGIGFGWVSRRFERQADLFGARCAAPVTARDCTVPCSVHPDDATTLGDDGGLCATGAMVFASALQRVAALNGIPVDERSWRHASIRNRIDFLVSAADDPRRLRRFERIVRRVQRLIWAAAIAGVGALAWYGSVVPQPAVLRITAGQS